MKKIAFLLLSLLVIGSHYLSAGTVSFDQLAASSDLTAAKYNGDLNTIFQDYNSNIQSSNVAADTIAEVDMADDANPRLRDYELGGSGTECEMVYTGLLTTTTSGTLTGSVPAGTAYPRGYRVVKSSSTPKTFTASRWTFLDIDTQGNLTYSEVSIGAAAPSVAPNSIRISRVSTDGTQIAAVQDLRTLSCTSAKFTTTREVTSEAALDDLLRSGATNRRFSPAGRTPSGWAQGAFVSWDAHTTFKVTAGSLYINGKYRAVSTDITVTTGADDPANGISGIDTGSVTGGPVTYYVYGVADQSSVSTYSVSFSTSATAPSGLTNYRLLGTIRTDITNLFTSRDTVTMHGISEREIIGGWITFVGTGGIVSSDSWNVSSIGDNGTGDYTVTWDADFVNGNYALAQMAKQSGSDQPTACSVENATAQAAGSVRIECMNGGSAVDAPTVSLIAFGDTRR